MLYVGAAGPQQYNIFTYESGVKLPKKKKKEGGFGDLCESKIACAHAHKERT